MNKRIKELAEQAGCKVMDGEWYIPSATGIEKIVYTKGTGLEKFAELIVQECMRMCEVTEMSFVTHECDVEASGAITVKQFIAEHFGVDTEIDTNKKIEESLHKADKDIQEGLRKQYLEQLTRLNGDLS